MVRALAKSTRAYVPATGPIAMRGLILGSMLGLAGCMGVGETLRVDAGAIDRTVTGSIPTEPALPQVKTDQQALADAVSGIDLQRRPEGPYAWANPVTGTTGVISMITEAGETGAACRDFTTTMHSYEGIALFAGRGCRASEGWNLTAFQPVQPTRVEAN